MYLKSLMEVCCLSSCFGQTIILVLSPKLRSIVGSTIPYEQEETEKMGQHFAGFVVYLHPGQGAATRAVVRQPQSHPSCCHRSFSNPPSMFSTIYHRELGLHLHFHNSGGTQHLSKKLMVPRVSRELGKTFFSIFSFSGLICWASI